MVNSKDPSKLTAEEVMAAIDVANYPHLLAIVTDAIAREAKVIKNFERGLITPRELAYEVSSIWIMAEISTRSSIED